MVSSDLITGLIFGGIGTFLGMVLIIGFPVFLIFLSRLKDNRLIRVTNITAGKPKIEWYRARKIKHKDLGDCYIVPSLKKEGRPFIPFYGSEFEYPTNNKLMYVPVTFYKNTYSPENYEFMEVVELEQIVFNKDTKKYEKVLKKVNQPIVTPTKSSMRQFNLSADKAIDEEFSSKNSWWAKYGALAVSAILFIGTVLLCVFIIIMTYQASVDGAFAVQNTPEWAATILDFVTTSQAPPVAG